MQIQKTIWDCENRGQLSPQYIQKNKLMGMLDYDECQQKAIQNALTNRLTLIQGPPGTGKTRVLAAIVANL